MTHRNLFFCVVGVIFLSIFSHFFLQAPRDFPLYTIVNVKDGSTTRSVSSKLYSLGIIRSRVMFESFLILFSNDRGAISGDYFFEKKLPVVDVARRLAGGERNLAPVKVTIPEGYSTSEIAEVLTKKLPNFDINNFLTQTKLLEGYLFPDTYFFLTTDTEKEVIENMSENFEKKISSIRPKILSSGKTEKEIIIMASIIEEESKGDIDRDLVSGILWKRIKIGMPLQVDVYPDTYKTKGLPKSPISNPGMASIEASLYPKSSPYLYYLHDKDGVIHFAKSFAEHQQNINKYLKNQ